MRTLLILLLLPIIFEYGGYSCFAETGKQSQPVPGEHEYGYPLNLSSPSEEEKRLIGVIGVGKVRISFAETVNVPRIAGTEVAWFLFQPSQEPVIVHERYYAPAPTQWSDHYKPTDSGRGGIGTWVQRPINGWISGARRLMADDPAGHWRVEVTINDKLLHTFEYDVVTDKETIDSFLRLAHQPNLDKLVYKRAEMECSKIHRGTGLAKCIVEKMERIKSLLAFERALDPTSKYERKLYKTAYDACERLYGSGLTSLPCIKNWMNNQRGLDALKSLYGK